MTSFYEWFYNVILTSANSVPIQSQWVAFFVNPLDLNRAIQAGNFENGFGFYSLAAGAAINTAQGALGALFANSVKIPGDGMNVSKLGPDGCGLIKGNISSGRQDMENLSISFLDTNMSFADYNIRPWTIYASHKSLKDPAVKTTIVILQLAKSGAGNPLLPRAIWTFHDACPVSIESQEWNYGEDNVVSRTVEFSYNYYLLNADPLISPANTVASIIRNTTDYKSQSVITEVGGLKGHGRSQNVNVSDNDATQARAHTAGQQVVIPKDDMVDQVSRTINSGLNILNGNSNVKIQSDDVIKRLKTEGEEILKSYRIIESDTPEHNKGTKQEGFVEKRSDVEDHVMRVAEQRTQSGRVPVGGNSKQNMKDLSDTPVFFPNDGNEESKKIVGRTVGGALDTPRGISISSQIVVVPRNGNVSKNIPLQIVTVNRKEK